MKKFTLLALLLCVLPLGGCEEEEYSLNLESYSATLRPGESCRIGVTGTDLRFLSRDTQIARVNDGGRVTAVAPGRTTIDIVAREGSAMFEVTVIGK